MTYIPSAVLIAIFIAIFIVFLFFGRKSYIPLLLIFIYLLPRAGIKMSWPWILPLPFGYPIIILLSLKWLSGKIYPTSDRTKGIYTPIANIFKWFSFLCLYSLITGFRNSIVTGTTAKSIIAEYIIYYITFFTYFIIVNINIRKEDIRLFVNSLPVVAFLVSLYGIFSIFTGPKTLIYGITYNDSGIWGDSPLSIAFISQFSIAKRTLASYGDPNVLGGQLVVFISIIVAFLFIKNLSHSKKMFLYLNLLINIICLYLTGSRSALVSILIVFIIFAFFRFNILLILVPLAITGFIIFKDFIFNIYVHRLFTMGLISKACVFNPNFIFDLVMKFPFGVGFGNTVGNDITVKPVINLFFGFNSYHVHILSRIGIFGYIVLLILLVSLFRYFLISANYIKDENIRAFVWGGGVGLIIQQLSYVANNVYMLPGGALNFWVMCGMLTLGIHFYKNR